MLNMQDLEMSSRQLIIKVLRLLWPQYMNGPQEHSLSIVLQSLFIQKILRINSHVPWPVHPTSKVLIPEKIERGTRTPGLARGCHIDGRNGIIFGKNVWIGPRVCIISQNHDVLNYRRYIKQQGIRIGDNCWIGAGAIILPGVYLGNHTIVGAGAVVTKSFPDGDILVAGNPAKIKKIIGRYNPENE
jgi:acetyltransferase-like isoleucine patch superfamily enzyme